MGQQPLGIVLKGRGNGLCLEAALNAFQQLQVVTDDHIGPLLTTATRMPLTCGPPERISTSRPYFCTARWPEPDNTPLFRLGVPGGQQNDFLLGLNGQRDTAEGPSGPASVCPGKACACFHIPLPLYAGRGSERMWLSLPSRSTLNRDMVTEQCPVWITRTDRFYSHSAIQKQCQI